MHALKERLFGSDTFIGIKNGKSYLPVMGDTMITKRKSRHHFSLPLSAHIGSCL